MVSPFAGNTYKGYYTITEGKNNLKINVSYEAQAADKFFLYIFSSYIKWIEDTSSIIIKFKQVIELLS